MKNKRFKQIKINNLIHFFVKNQEKNCKKMYIEKKGRVQKSNKLIKK